MVYKGSRPVNKVTKPCRWLLMGVKRSRQTASRPSSTEAVRRQQLTATSSMRQSPVAHGSIVAAAKRNPCLPSAPCRARSAAANSMYHTQTTAIF